MIKNAFLHTGKKPADGRHAQKLPFLRKNFSALQNGSKAGLPALRPLEKLLAFPTHLPPSRFPNDRLSPTKTGKDAHGDCYRTGFSPVSLFTPDARLKRAEPDFAFGSHAAARHRRHFVHTNILFFRLYHTARFYARKILLKIQTPQTFEHKMSCSSFGSFSLSSSFWQMPRLKISLSFKKRS